MKKRILALLLAVIMVLSLAACGKNGNGDGDKQVGSNGIKNPASKEGVYEYTDIEVDFGVEEVNYYNFNRVKVIDDVIYMIVNISFNNGNAQRYITMDMSGNVLSNTVLYEQIWEPYDDTEVEVMPLASVKAEVAMAMPAVTTEEITKEENTSEESGYEEYHNIWNYEILEDGRLVYVEMYEKYFMENWELVESSSTLVICDNSGQETARIAMEPELEEGEYFYVNTLIPGKDNQLFVMCDGFHFVVDVASGTAKKVEANDVTRDIYSPMFYKDGLPVVGIWNDDYTKQTYFTVDLSTGEKVEEVAIPDTFMNYNYFDGSGSGYDLILAGSNGVYGYRFGDEVATPLMDYINSDLATYRVRNISFIDNENFVAVYNDIIDSTSHLASFTKVPPEEVPDKEGLTLAVYYTDTEITKRVIEFNKASDKYRILVKDYSQYATYEDYEAGITQLNNEIISGKIPDIIHVSENIPIENYASKGMLADFYKLIEQDETINLEDYCTNVFKAYEMDGKLYQLPTGFYIMTVLGKTSIFGEENNLTWEELNSVMAEYPEASVFSDMTKERALRTALRFAYTQLVDSETGECHFNSDKFKKILEFANTFPEKINYDELYNDEDYKTNHQLQYMEDRTLLLQSTVYTIYDVWRSGYSSFLEEVTPVGYPTDEGQGSVLSAISSYAISAKSAGIDGAWEFVKGFISEEAQLKEDEDARYAYWGFPILKKALEQSAEVLKTKPYYLDENNEKVEYDETVYVNGEEIVLEPATEEEVQKWLDFIYSVEQRGTYDFEQAMEIISEEVAHYFGGQKRAEEVAGIIQSRMDIFISENR